MRKEQRENFLKKLDGEQYFFQKAGTRSFFYRMWLKDVRHALGVTMRELEERLKTSRASLYRLEQREKEGTAMLCELEEVAHAMGCKLVYCIVPQRGTLADVLERRKRWSWEDSKEARRRVDERIAQGRAASRRSIEMFRETLKGMLVKEVRNGGFD